MTERTIRSLSKELAGAFYEQNRSKGFRIAFPTVRDYIRGHWHRNDGTITAYTPGWHFFVEIARRMLVQMLARKDITEPMKERIADALIEENANAISARAKNVFQVSNVQK